MASKAAVFLTLNLLFFTLVSSTCTDSTGTDSTGTNSAGNNSNGNNSNGTDSTGTNSNGNNSNGNNSTGTDSTVTNSTGNNSNDNNSTGTNGTCPMNALKLGVCANLLNGLVNVTLGDPPTQPCCSLINGLADLEAAVCLCTALKANVLGINLNVPLQLSLLLNNCGSKVPTGFECVLG